jgi:hypothetical protein
MNKQTFCHIKQKHWKELFMFVEYFEVKQLYGFNSAVALQYLLVWLTKTFPMGCFGPMCD